MECLELRGKGRPKQCSKKRGGGKNLESWMTCINQSGATTVFSFTYDLPGLGT